uniref:Uncharacterized protein n=1 Tax=Sinocyclocheilus anshuiensis TaxID=1608454 RepID=A0A671R0T5_9TELE
MRRSSYSPQTTLLCLVSQAQSGRTDEQRCSINPLSPGHMDNKQTNQCSFCSSTSFKQIKMSRRFLNSLLAPKIGGSMTSGQHDQRCSAPKIQLGSPAPPKEVSFSTRIPVWVRLTH